MKPIASMLARTAEGAILANPDGKVIFCNKAAESLLGFRAAEVVGRPCHEVIRGILPNGKPLCSSSCPVFFSLVRGKAVRHFDVQTTTASGDPIWLSVSSLCLPSRRDGGCYIVHLFHDITRQAKVKQLAQALYAAVCSLPSLSRPVRPSALPRSFEPESVQSLTPREREILDCLRRGMGTASIADRLCISPVTVRNHIQHILEKLGAHSRLEALALAASSSGGRATMSTGAERPC